MTHDLDRSKVLQKLLGTLTSYREMVDRLFSESLLEPKDWRAYFSDLLISVSQLHLGCLIFVHNSYGFEAGSSFISTDRLPKIDISREQSFRSKLRAYLESRIFWDDFHPEDASLMPIELRTAQDYLDNLSLHLPEIYEESLRIEGYVNVFRESSSGLVFTSVIVGLQHISRNHIAFVQPTLEWISNEDLWEK